MIPVCDLKTEDTVYMKAASYLETEDTLDMKPVCFIGRDNIMFTKSVCDRGTEETSMLYRNRIHSVHETSL
ncbi:hypothetical protein DPMN_139320 [Dreissena polymorpha]|uniref:Uncharacterized protein n=1 Tax=Dreissena polymorpha TaxID=45954 RepID=A0A9D4JFJ5_DREPO|nr:hypothetical protein DPMN_133042 [Dreissena polymorpha]KAH3810921.1 hypothetical protein DPMN_139320 [Dreissena polymorpha]